MKGVISLSIRRIGFYVMSLFLIVPAFGQPELSNLIADHNILNARESKRELSYESIAGNPYYSKNYVKSAIYVQSGDSVTLDLRFDLFINEMEYRQNGSSMWLVKHQVKGLRYGHEKVIVAEIAGEKDPVYMFVVEDGPFALLRKESVAFMKAEPAKPYSEPVPERFETEQVAYYIKNNNFPAQPVMTRKQMDEIVMGKPEAIEFVKKQKTKPAKEKDLIKLVQFLNTL